MPHAQEFDFIFAGAGASGLALAYFLPASARVLLVDKVQKTKNDRTWCFWESNPNPFDHLVYHRWDNIFFHAPDFSNRFNITPYQYKMIRSIDLYEFLVQELQKRPNVQFEYGQIEHLESDNHQAQVTVNGTTHTAPWSFNSALRPNVPSDYHHLLQHFKGYVLKTKQDVFDPNAATFMDFRIAQNNETRFVYVLPFDSKTALVEYTLFSSTLLPESEYDTALHDYLKHYLKLEQYDILETEAGVIPMTDAPFPRLHSPRVMNIGIAGGRAKASTGYAFKRILYQAQAIATHIKETNSPLFPQSHFDRHAWMDSVYLRVLEQKRIGGASFFSDLFKHNPATTVLKFLDEATSPFEDLKLMSSVNIPIFTRSAIEITAQNVQRSLLRVRGVH
jgi:lycopene beta-cyclase